jgi:7-cyano-7-deazaguanine synthase
MAIVASNAQVDGHFVGGMMLKYAVMALSGGMDSTSLLLRLLREGTNVTAVSFNYGQKHIVELERATSLVAYLRENGHHVDHHLADLQSALALFRSDLLLTGGEVPQGHYEEDNMKATVVPNRNAIFSSILYGLALSRSEEVRGEVSVVLGVHSGDHAIYPDCRPEFYRALEHAFQVGNWDSERVAFKLPFLEGDKTSILRDALESVQQLGLDFDEVFKRTITSYDPDSDGRSQGRTGSDVERILAFNAIGRADPIEYVEPWETVLAEALQIERKHKDEHYRNSLTPLQYHVTREAGTERPFTGETWDEQRPGTYTCICCDTLLFLSSMKFDSGCGWPSFHSEHREANIERIEDRTLGMVRTELRCSSCDAHLGHVFNDGPRAYGGERYCINSASMNFKPEEEQA